MYNGISMLSTLILTQLNLGVKPKPLCTHENYSSYYVRNVNHDKLFRKSVNIDVDFKAANLCSRSNEHDNFISKLLKKKIKLIKL